MYSRKQMLHLLRNPDSGHTHTGTDAHAGDTDLLVCPLQFSKQSADLAGTSASKRVTECNSTTLGVDLLLGNTKLVDTPDALGSEGLVDLVDVDIILSDAGLLQSNGDSLPRANTHEEGLDADDAGGNVLAEDLLAQTLGGGALHEEDGGGAVGDLGSVTGVDGAVLGKGGLDLAQRLGGDALPDAVVGLHVDGLLLAGLGVGPFHIQRGDLLVEETSLLGLEGLLV